ncbi:MAG TPA: hypothetical protein VJQ49_02865 [Casimicrobiaceae bacterium]|nr:hypothetical protein [Casimicrobiaceae bacterium]
MVDSGNLLEKRIVGSRLIAVLALGAALLSINAPVASAGVRGDLLAAHLALTDKEPLAVTSRREIEDRILALDPDRISDDDVRNTLAAGPTPRIVLVHGGVIGVYLVMESFGKFMVGMGYPESRIRDPHSGAWSQNPYGSSERLAGELAWHYEHDGLRPMLIGHSQGGMQTVKVLHDLAGDFGPRIPVWNPVTDEATDRYTIVDPLGHDERPVVGVKLSYASVVGAGGLEFWAPTDWALAGRLRAIPDSVVDFTGYSIAGDPIALIPPSGATAYDRYRRTGSAGVRNVDLPLGYNHVTVPDTEQLLAVPGMRKWINHYAGPQQVDMATIPGGDDEHVLWAADVWHSIKRHWCLEAQRLIQAERGEMPASRSAQR